MSSQQESPRLAPRAESEKTFSPQEKYHSPEHEVKINAEERSPEDFLATVLPTAPFYCVSINKPGQAKGCAFMRENTGSTTQHYYARKTCAA